VKGTLGWKQPHVHAHGRKEGPSPSVLVPWENRGGGEGWGEQGAKTLRAHLAIEDNPVEGKGNA